MQDHPPTPRETLLMAYDTAKAAGVKFVYVGNVHDPLHDSTYCPFCSTLLIERNWHDVGAYHLRDNRCPRCNGIIAGRFLSQAGTWGRRRLPVRIANFARPPQPQPAPDNPAATHRSSARDTGPQLTERQEHLVFRAACEMVVAGVGNRPAHLPDPTLDGASEISVMGAFVTLKRKRHLRACCGSLGRPMPLLEALRGAAHRTATDDTRLPPISVTELPYLDIDVSLLHDFQIVEQEGADRARAISIGRHGLTIHRAQMGGLLLPNVAVEHNWDPETFLRQLCRKAGIPSHAWQDSASKLQTFETTVIEGVIDSDLLHSVSSVVPPLYSSQELTQLADHCRANILALIQGATPNYYLPACSDANVQGVVLALELPARDVNPQFARLAMRPGMPLQSTLFQLAEAAARWVRGAQIPVESLSELRCNVAVLYNSALHGTVARPDLRGLDPQRRAVAVAEHGRYAWMYAPSQTAEQLLETAADRTQVFDPQAAGVYSFAADASVEPLLVTNILRPQLGPPVRRPAVAGTFYPAQAAELQQMLKQLVTVEGVHAQGSWPAILVPHAGLRYSGSIAAQVFQRVAIPDRVVILAPKHTRQGTPWAVAPHKTWSLPGLQVESDCDLAERLAHAIPRLELDAAAHQDEHAIEVQLPLLAYLAPQTQVVGITIGEGGLEDCCEFAEHLAQLLRSEPNPPLLVISSDLNHYASEDETRRLDGIALSAICQLDPHLLFHTVREHDISMCGVLPAVMVMETLRHLDSLHTCEQVAYATSADAGGSTDRVVGYAGLLFR